MSPLADVAVLLPVAGTFTYAVPEGLRVTPGSRVWVSFSGRSAEGVVLSIDATAPFSGRVKALSRVLDAPPLDPSLFPLARWIAEYYMAPLGEALRLFLPPGGRVAEAKRVQLTDAGRRAAAGLGQALEPAELDGLPLRERALLERLQAAGGDEKATALTRDLDGGTAALKALEKRALVTRSAALSLRGSKMERFARVLAVADAAARLARAPARRATWERISAAGEIALSSLRATDPLAATHLRALVAAGLCAVEERAIRTPTSTPTASAGGLPTAAPAAPSPAPGDQESAAPPPTLTVDQGTALDALVPAITAGGYAGFLLHGATGSGKTEVYLRAIEIALGQGRGALVLVPEISLTPQLAARFRARFGDAVAVLHSGLSDRDRFAAWSRLSTGDARIALGPRSAVFAPVPRLGVVVIDEEHDGSFKQEDGLRYHGRDVAMRRAQSAGATAILGSATPAVETFDAARAGRLRLLSLPGRANGRPLPAVEVIDLRLHRAEPGALLSAPLAAALGETLEAGEQAILFLNRRGFATFVLCTACGHRFACRHCAVTLTWHRAEDRLACHYCGYLEPTPTRCTKCQAQSIERLGLGTERVEAAVAERFPKARVARLDRDTAAGQGLGRILERIRRREIDVVVGTQMIAKGHDFPGVTLVGVVLADHGMNVPDYRASERTFQILAQVAGRAGRGDRPGRVLIQSYNPEHPSVVRAKTHDYLGFFEEEAAARKEHLYPPFSRLGLVRADGADPIVVRRIAESAAAAARGVAGLAPEGARVEILGPAEAPLSRLKGKARWQLLVKAATPKAVRAVLQVAVSVDTPRGVRLSADVDPVSML